MSNCFVQAWYKHWPSSAKRKSSGLGSKVSECVSFSICPSAWTLRFRTRVKSRATSSNNGRKRRTAELNITSRFNSNRSERHSAPFLHRHNNQYKCITHNSPRIRAHTHAQTVHMLIHTHTVTHTLHINRNTHTHIIIDTHTNACTHTDTNLRKTPLLCLRVSRCVSHGCSVIRRGFGPSELKSSAMSTGSNMFTLHWEPRYCLWDRQADRKVGTHRQRDRECKFYISANPGASFTCNNETTVQLDWNEECYCWLSDLGEHQTLPPMNNMYTAYRTGHES